MNFENCPICNSSLKQGRLQRHLQKQHGLDHIPTQKEARYINEQKKQQQKQWTEQKRRWKVEIKILILRLRNGDSSALPDLEQFMQKSVTRKMVLGFLHNNRKGKFARSHFPRGGHSVQGGSPGLGKRR
jgi:hypothetical protein